MAWYGVDYSCGHSGRMQIYGPVRDRQAIADREGHKECADCYQVRLDREHAEASAKAIAANTASGLPALTGSPRQIAWAETIRAKKIADVELISTRPELRSDIAAMSGAPIELVVRVIAQKLVEYRATEAAKYWIDNRTLSAEAAILRRLARITTATKEASHA